MAARYLNISRDLSIFFINDKVEYRSSEHDPEAAQSAVYRWQGENSDHPDFDLSEKWLAEYKPPSPSEGVAEALGIPEHEGLNWLPYFKKLKAEIQSSLNLPDEEARSRALEKLKNLPKFDIELPPK